MQPEHKDDDLLQFQSIGFSQGNTPDVHLQDTTVVDLGAPFESPFAQPPPAISQPPLVTATTPAATTDTNKAQETRAFWTIEFYQPYFNVDLQDILKRMLGSVTFFRTDFLESIKDKADLYGPFWIITTLLVVMVITSNIGGFINITLAQRELASVAKGGASLNDTVNPLRPDTKSITEWSHDFTKVSVGSGFLYTFGILIPLLMWLFMKWKGVAISLVEHVAVFNYALTVYLPTAILCVITVELVRWLLVSVSMIWACLFLLFTWIPVWRKHLTSAQDLPIVILLALYVVISQLTLALFIKVFYFSSWV